MDTAFVVSPRRLSDPELVARVKHLACRERQATASLVSHLAELDERELYLAEGCSSLFNYCTEVLLLSEDAAYSRMVAAKAARKFPLIVQKLSDGSVHLTAVRLLAQHLTDDNHRDLLDQATRRSKREVEELVARIRPLPEVPSSVRRLPARGAATATAIDSRAAVAEMTLLEVAGPGSNASRDATAAPDGAARPPAPALPSGNPQGGKPDSFSVNLAQAGRAEAGGHEIAESPTGNSPSATQKPHAKLSPLAPDLYRVQFTADAETYKRLCQARELLRHQIPDGNAAAVIGLALKLLVDRLAQQKLGARKQRSPGALRARKDAGLSRTRCEPAEVAQTGKGTEHPESRDPLHGPREGAVRREPQNPRRTPAENSRHIPASVRREVWRRDQGRCAFISKDGRRCTERGRLEFHHVLPFARGGPANADNIQLRCRAHNQFEARLCFGPRVSPVPERVENVILGPP